MRVGGEMSCKAYCLYYLKLILQSVFVMRSLSRSYIARCIYAKALKTAAIYYTHAQWLPIALNAIYTESDIGNLNHQKDKRRVIKVHRIQYSTSTSASDR